MPGWLWGPNVSAIVGPKCLGTPAWAKMDPGSWAPSHFGTKARADETLLMTKLSPRALVRKLSPRALVRKLSPYPFGTGAWADANP